MAAASVSDPGPDPASIRSVDPDPDSGGQKLPQKIEKVKKFHVLKCSMFSCSVAVLYGGPGISKL